MITGLTEVYVFGFSRRMPLIILWVIGRKRQNTYHLRLPLNVVAYTTFQLVRVTVVLAHGISHLDGPLSIIPAVLQQVLCLEEILAQGRIVGVM